MTRAINAPGPDLGIALNPDALHHETQRRLNSGDQAQPLILERGYTNLGQLITLPCAVLTAPPVNSSINTTPWGE
ncbi:hypothetical protein [Vreelandella titanicae]|uniref:hypothetical protein n=1 Tax=Vreelandella titanicae TaxID=664683 RepID=UPI00381C0A13